MIPNDESNELKSRVEGLEKEVGELRKRVALLEGGEKVFTEPAAASASVGQPPPPPVPPPLMAAMQKQQTPPPVPTVLPPVPRQPVAPPPLRREVPAEPSSLEKALRALHLLPPKGEGSGEVQLGAWWATRIGAVVFVIGIVFAGVYFSLDTAPWVKLAELAAVSVGVCFFGLWVERKLPQFGSVVVGAGLGLIYFTAFAAYAVPAVKVVDDLYLAGGLQIAAVALILFAAVRRHSPTAATMAVLLGYVSAFSSLSAGFDDFAVFGSLAIVAIGVLFHLRRGWAVPLGTSAVLNHALYMVVAWQFWETEAGRTSPVVAFSVLGLGFAAVLSSVLIEQRKTGEPAAKAQRWIQALNTSLAVLAGFVAATILLPDVQLSWYFFGAGAVLLVVAVYLWRTVPRDPLFAMFAVKASALVALGAATEWGTRTRWVALLVEAFVLLAAGKRTRRPTLFVAAVAAWSAAMYFFAGDVWGLKGLLLTTSGAVAALFVVAAPVFWLLAVRWWPEERGTGMSDAKGLFAAVSTVPLFLFCPLFVAEPWGALGTFFFAAVLVGIARWTRSIIPLAASVVAFGFAQYILHTFDSAAHGLNWMWASVAVLAVAAGAVGWRAAEVEGVVDDDPRENRLPGTAAQWRAIGAVLQTLALAALFFGLYEIGPAYQGLGLTAGISAIVVCAAVFAGRSVSAASGVFGLAVAGVLGVARLTGSFDATAGGEWLWVLAAAAPVSMATLGGGERVREELEAMSWFSKLTFLCLVVGVIAAPTAAAEQFKELGFVWSLVVVAAVYFTIGVARRVGAAFAASSIILAFALFSFAVENQWRPAVDGWAALVAAFVATIAFGALPVLAKQYSPWLPAARGSFWRVAHVVIATFCVIRIATESSGPWASYGSVVWALGGICLFVIGLFFRARSHRIAGLLTLALCIPRVFLIDINSTLYRIAAFVVLGVVLLWVGFSYQRFRHLVEDEQDETTDETEPEN